MKTLFALAFAPGLFLQACGDIKTVLPGNMRPPELTTCGAVELQEAVGRNISEIDATTRERARIIRPGQVVTMDFNTARLNIELDGEDRIKRIWCG